MSGINQKMLPVPPVIKQDGDKGLVFLKTIKNKLVEDAMIKRMEHGSSETHTLEANTSCLVKLLIDCGSVKACHLVTSLVCKDSLGSLTHYIINEAPNELVCLVENTTPESRTFHINYVIFYSY